MTANQLKLTINLLIIATTSLCLTTTHAATAPGVPFIEKLKVAMNIDIEYDPGKWTLSRPGTPSDYFRTYKSINYAYFAQSSDETCRMDSFAAVYYDQKGSVLDYTAMEHNSYIEGGVSQNNRNMSFVLLPGAESEGAAHIDRVAGITAAWGKASIVGTLHSRHASVPPDTIYKNIAITIVNNMSMMTLYFSAPEESWTSSACTAPVADVISSLSLYGEPDPREDRMKEKRDYLQMRDLRDVIAELGGAPSSRPVSSAARPAQPESPVSLILKLSKYSPEEISAAIAKASPRDRAALQQALCALTASMSVAAQDKCE